MMGLFSVGFLVSLSGCVHPATLQYDFARSYDEIMELQADRDRPGAADQLYELTGEEALAIRMRSTDASTDEESGDPEAVLKFEVE